MGAWDGSDDDPCGDDSLCLLYYLCPAAEELDLADEVRRERLTALSAVEERDEDLGTTVQQEGEDHEGTVRLTLAQILGMLAHYLGAHRIEETPDDPAD